MNSTHDATISKEFHFSASHQLTHLDAIVLAHPCARLHGHNYVVVLTLFGAVDPRTGFVVDYNELRAFGAMIDDTFDHRHLNDVLGSSEATTAENMAQHFLQVAVTMFGLVVSSCTVKETPKTSCTVYV